MILKPFVVVTFKDIASTRIYRVTEACFAKLGEARNMKQKVTGK